jgi:glucose-1-phosphate thymidylyltransferase
MATHKGIILAGGSGSRLTPLTKATSKQLLPVYDKPMIYYPLSVLMLAGIKEVMVITTPEDSHAFRRLLGDGSKLGLNIGYAVQQSPKGLAQAFLIARDFIDQKPVSLVLGDNVIYGHGLRTILIRAAARDAGATIFAYSVRDPERYGVVELDPAGRPLSIQEKPKHPKSRFAVPGLYFYDANVVEIASQLKPSPRGELEITDVHQEYLDRGLLSVEVIPRGLAWLDAGTFDSLLQASNYVQTVQERQSSKIACLEEIAFRVGLISRGDLLKLAEAAPNEHRDYLLGVVNEVS